MRKQSRGPHHPTRRPSYRTARLVARLISGIGWSILVVLLTLGAALAWHLRDPLVAILGGIGAFGGLLVVALGQWIRANLDTADHTREIRDRLWSQEMYYSLAHEMASEHPGEPRSKPRSSSTADRSGPSPSSSKISSEMAETVASQSAVRCVNPLCDRLLPDAEAVCPHCGMRQSLVLRPCRLDETRAESRDAAEV
ncbi:hypothetical protein [Thiorhodococcus fuscus]|uniref:Zinc ribbon domain-containing protein n=1 Tax=Thiorhodococcus fuscus TaxID=527200 RepID=A0ABW4Y6N2_9GAMM